MRIKILKYFLIFWVALFTIPIIANAAAFWSVQSIDTMKYSRDEARTQLKSKSFEAVINAQIKAIADTGATHVSIGTPYDPEFLPFLKKWVSAARKNDLNVWFRGNWSGWEGWFSYPKINQNEHVSKTEKFILDNPDLFKDGDIFTACPECENGGPGDPRFTQKLTEYRGFLIKEHDVMESAFNKIGKKVVFNYNSMNGDVAFLVMDKKTTQALGGVITIDHYVKTKERLVNDIRKLSEQGGGAKIVLGEFGAPIPDIHGKMSDIDQAKWVQDALLEMAVMKEVEGINYWVNVGGSTQIWNDKLEPEPTVEVLSNFYDPKLISGYIKDDFNNPVSDAIVSNEYGISVTDSSGYFEIPYISFVDTEIKVERTDFETLNKKIGDHNGEILELVIKREKPDFKLFIIKAVQNFTNFIIHLFANKQIEI